MTDQERRGPKTGGHGENDDLTVIKPPHRYGAGATMCNRGVGLLFNVYEGNVRKLREQTFDGAVLCNTPYTNGEDAVIPFAAFVEKLTAAIGHRLVDAIKAGKIVLAGGAVLALLMHGRLLDGADVDLFAIAVDMTEAGFRELLADLAGAMGDGQMKVHRSPNCVEVEVRGLKFQLIRRVEPSIAALLHGFDFACCKVAVTGDGSSNLVVLATPDALEALETRLNVAHGHLRSF